MAALTQTAMTGPGQRLATENSLSASDTFQYTFGKRQMIVLLNGTGGSITPQIRGAGVSAFPIPGADGVNGPSGDGWNRPIASGTMAVIDMDGARHFWSSTVNITGGSGLTCWILGQ